jgi:hypothetical protein
MAESKMSAGSGHLDEEGSAMEQRDQQTRSAQSDTTMDRAARVDLGDFAEALSTGVLRALDRRRLGADDKGGVRIPWTWAGWIIGPEGPWGPGGDGPFGGEGPFGGKGPSGPGG